MPAKKDPYSGPSQKIIGLFSLFLFSGRAYTLSQLAQMFRCSKQTILRMLEQIERSQWLLIDSWTEGREKYYQVRKSKKMPNVSLDAEALGKLLLCRDMVWHMLPENYRKEVTQALQGATTLLPDFDDRDGAMASYTLAKPKGMIDYTDKEALITDLIRAIREHRMCEVRYVSPRHTDPQSYVVAPYQMIVFHEGLYLRCRPKDLLATPTEGWDLILAVHRMREVRPLEEHFKQIKISKDAQHLAGAFGLTQGNPFRVRVKVNPGAALYVRERIWSDDQSIIQNDDGSLLLEFTTTSSQETVAWILSFGGEMQLLAPEHLRERIRACAVTIGEAHQ